MVKILILIFIVIFSITTFAKTCSEKNVRDILTMSGYLIENLREFQKEIIDQNENVFKRKNEYTTVGSISMTIDFKSKESQRKYFDVVNAMKDTIRHNPECKIIDFPDLKNTK